MYYILRNSGIAVPPVCAGPGAASRGCSLASFPLPGVPRKLHWILLMALCLAAPVVADNGSFSLFLVRHAEKQTADPAAKDPSLTACGQRRAEHIAAMLESIPVQRVYSSDYRRTRATAEPVAGSRNLDLAFYDPRQLTETANLLLARAEDAVVVGHSNTTGVLAGLLAGETGAAFDENLYDRLYQVVVAGEERRLYLYHQGFECNAAGRSPR